MDGTLSRCAILLDQTGQFVRALPADTVGIAGFTDDGSLMAVWDGTTARVLNTATGATVYQSTPVPQMSMGRVALSSGGSTLATLSYLPATVPNYSPIAYPTQIVLRVHAVASGLIFSEVIPRDDETVAAQPPHDCPDLHMASDGAYIAVTSRRRWLAVHAVPGGAP